jgi:nucleotide-binding universal stress UspA family protein
MKAYRIRNILVPTDFSRLSQYGFHHARQIAKLTRARITLLNVVEPMGGAAGTSGMLGMAEILEKKLRQRNTRRLERAARAIASHSRVKVAARVTVGSVAPMIRKTAEEIGADLIVMGTHGANGFMENLLGSNTYRIASLSRIPLLSVHKNLGRAGYRHIVYPVRDLSGAGKKFQHALMFARLFRAPVHIIGHLRMDRSAEGKSLRAHCAKIQMAFIKRKVEVETVFTEGEFFPDAVIRYAHGRAGSLVVITQDTDFHLVEVFQGTFSKRILHSILSPVLSITP